jgi:single-strand DNA-binding protein
VYQKVTLIGNLGRDPEMRYTPSGVPVTNFSVAANRRWTNSDGSPGEETVWIRVTAWRRLAEVCNEYLAKGRQVYIEGTLKPDPDTGGPRVYERNDGSYGASYELTASMVKFLGGNGATKRAADEGMDEPADEEIPF